MPAPSNGYGDNPWGDSPFGDDPGIIALSPDGNQLVQDTLSSVIDLSSVNTSVLRMIIYMCRNRTGIVMDSLQNSYLQTQLMTIIEAEGRSAKETKQHRLAVRALRALQVV